MASVVTKSLEADILHHTMTVPVINEPMEPLNEKEDSWNQHHPDVKHPTPCILTLWLIFLLKWIQYLVIFQFVKRSHLDIFKIIQNELTSVETRQTQQREESLGEYNIPGY